MSRSIRPARGIASCLSLVTVFSFTVNAARPVEAAEGGRPASTGGRVEAAEDARSASAEDQIRQLQRAIEELREELLRLERGEGTEHGRIAELERRIDLLAREIEKLRTGGAVEEAPLEGEKGLGPAASTVYRKAHGVAIGGYGEAIYTNYAELRQDEQPSGLVDEFDFLRAVFYVGYKFSDSILFNSEIEIEHASTGEGGEVSVEFAYLEFQKRPEIGLRAGMLLMPVGFLNEQHEPPTYHGSRRPAVERAIIPTTWRENGAGLFGAAGPFEYRGYVVVGLHSSGFSAAGIRGGRQNGARSLAEDLAVAGRLDYVGTPGLLLGASFYTGDSGQGAVVDDQTFGGRVTLFDVHAQYEYRGLQLRALWAGSTIDDVPLIDAQNGLVGDQSVGESQRGWYVEAAFDVMSLAPKGRWGIVPFVRYEEFDTQREVPPGFDTDPRWDRSLLTAGLDIKPIPQVVFKVDFQLARDGARTGVNRLNASVGYLF